MMDKAEASGRRSPDDVSSASSGTTASQVKRWRVLVVDDEPAIGRLIRNLLPQHDTHIASSGERGLDLLREGAAFDVIVCDVMMPDVSGMDLYERIVAERPELARRFVFVTGGAFTERTRSFLDRILARRIDKPFAIASLEAAMEATIAEAESRAAR